MDNSDSDLRDFERAEQCIDWVLGQRGHPPLSKLPYDILNQTEVQEIENEAVRLMDPGILESEINAYPYVPSM